MKKKPKNKQIKKNPQTSVDSTIMIQHLNELYSRKIL